MPNYRMLIVDDEKNILRVVSTTLKNEQYDVTTAQSAEEAIERFRRNGFDLVITDLKLPGQGGLDLVTAMSGVSAAYYLIHSMSGSTDFDQRDLQAAHILGMRLARTVSSVSFTWEG